MVFDQTEYNREYYINNKDKIKANSQTYKRIRSHRISNWKKMDIIIDDYEHYYDTVYFPATHCQICKVEFCEESHKPTSKNLDHDHLIKDRSNVRNILCSSCNSTSNRREMSKTNTSGYSNIRKRGNSYRVQITIRGKTTSKTLKTISEAIEYRDFIKNNI